LTQLIYISAKDNNNGTIPTFLCVFDYLKMIGQHDITLIKKLSTQFNVNIIM